MRYLMLLAALLALYWSTKSKRPITKFAIYALAGSIILEKVKIGGLDQYAPYAFAFFTLFAAFEPTNSFRFKNLHKGIFLYSGISSFLYAMYGLLRIPFEVYFEFLLLPIPILAIWVWREHKKVVYQRMAYMIIWSAQTMVALYSSNYVRERLSYLF